LDNVWESSQAPHQVYVDGLVDPSVWPAALGMADAMQGVLHAQGIKDLHSVTQHMFKAISTTVEAAGQTGLSTGFPSQLGDALTNVMAPQSVGSTVARGLVEATLTDGSKAGQQVATAMFAAGMSALSAAGTVGMAAAAIIGLAYAIYKAFDNAKAHADEEKKERVRRAFELFPPLQQPGGDTDEWYFKQRILPILETGTWTSLFSPRFDPRQEWVGAPRNGGYGFAPGVRRDTKDEFGFDLGIFETSGGIGFLPGFNRITSVIQVSIDPFGPQVQNWIKSGGPFPIHRAMAQDVGSYYVNAGRACSIAWSLATEERAIPHLYKIHVGTRTGGGTGHLHDLWKNYMQGGLEYLRESARQWENSAELGLKPGGRVRNAETPEYVLGSAVGCGVASWACSRAEGSTTNHPRFYRVGDGYPPDVYGISQGLAKGCVIEPMTPLYTPQEDSEPCLVSLYDSHLAKTLDEVRRRQVHFLKNSLVCAYVSESWDAFKDPELLSLLRRLRTKLLTHRDRHAVQLRDVPAGELHDGKDWRAQLRAAGVNALQGAGTRLSHQGPASSAVEPDDTPEPLVPVHGVMPFADLVQPAQRWWQNKRVLLGLGIGAVGVVGAAAAIRRARR